MASPVSKLKFLLAVMAPEVGILNAFDVPGAVEAEITYTSESLLSTPVDQSVAPATVYRVKASPPEAPPTIIESNELDDALVLSACEIVTMLGVPAAVEPPKRAMTGVVIVIFVDAIGGPSTLSVAARVNVCAASAVNVGG